MEKQPRQVDKRNGFQERPTLQKTESGHREFQEFLATQEEIESVGAAIEEARIIGADVNDLRMELAQVESELTKISEEGSSEVRFQALEERREKKLAAFFERREKQAQKIIKWMRLLEQVDVPSDEGVWPGERIKNDQQFFKDNLQKDIEDLPPAMQEAFERAWGLWALRVRNARRNIEALMKGRESKEGENDSETQGAILFEEQVESAPAGKVLFFNKGPFFYLTFEQRPDYERFKKSLTGLDERSEEGGVFLERAYWGKSEVPTLLQNGKEPKPHMLAHEGQHFLNHALGKQFASWEAGTEKSDLVQAERAIKDELLAYLRDGRAPQDIRRILTENDLYAHLYLDVDDRESAFLKEELQKICTALDAHAWTQPSMTTNAEDRQINKHKREMIVANLLDVPMPKMEKYIKQSAKFYAEKIQRMEPPPLPLEQKATASEKRQWKEEQSAFVSNYNNLLGLVPEFGLLAPEAQQKEALLDIAPPPLPPGNSFEDVQRYEREVDEGEKIHREKEKRRRRLDEI